MVESSTVQQDRANGTASANTSFWRVKLRRGLNVSWPQVLSSHNAEQGPVLSRFWLPEEDEHTLGLTVSVRLLQCCPSIKEPWHCSSCTTGEKLNGTLTAAIDPVSASATFTDLSIQGSSCAQRFDLVFFANNFSAVGFSPGFSAGSPDWPLLFATGSWPVASVPILPSC